MARGLSREQSKQKNEKAQGGNKGNQEGLSASARAERDAAKLQEKQRANEEKKKAMIASGNAAEVAALEAAKAAQREAKKERAANATQVAKQNAKVMGISTEGMGAKFKGAAVEKKEKKVLTPAELEAKRKKAALAAAALTQVSGKKEGKAGDVEMLPEEANDCTEDTNNEMEAVQEGMAALSASPVSSIAMEVEVIEPAAELSEEEKAARRAASEKGRLEQKARAMATAELEARKAWEEKTEAVRALISTGTTKLKIEDWNLLLTAVC